MYYQLPNGKTVYLTVEEYLNLTDADIQYLVSLNVGESVLNPFKGSVVNKSGNNKTYDFTFNDEDEDDSHYNNENPFDDIVDLSDNLDI